MKLIRLTAIITLVIAAASLAFRPALAADPVYPPGMRVGLTPLVGLVPAKAFVGFETEDHGVRVLVTELPAAAYGEVASAFKANPAGAGGVSANSGPAESGRSGGPPSPRAAITSSAFSISAAPCLISAFEPCARASSGEPDVTITGPPGELMLYAFGRESHALVETEGPADAVAALEAVERSW